MIEELIEQVVSAFRERGARGDIRWSPAWHDLDESDRRRAFDQTLTARELEAASNRRGLSSTAHAVLARVVGDR